jgi:hypothetical protein
MKFLLILVLSLITLQNIFLEGKMIRDRVHVFRLKCFLYIHKINLNIIFNIISTSNLVSNNSFYLIIPFLIASQLYYMGANGLFWI